MTGIVEAPPEDFVSLFEVKSLLKQLDMEADEKKLIALLEKGIDAVQEKPDYKKLIADLADYKEFYTATKLTKLHFYAFGGIKKTSDWLNAVNKPDLSYNGQKFE